MINKNKLNAKVSAVATVLKKRSIFPGVFVLQHDRLKRDVFVEYDDFSMRFPDVTFIKWTVPQLVNTIAKGFQECVGKRELKPALSKVGLEAKLTELIVEGGDEGVSEEGTATESPVAGSTHSGEVPASELVESSEPRPASKVKKASNTRPRKVKKSAAPKKQVP